MERLKALNEDQIIEVLKKAKVTYDPTSDHETLSGLALEFHKEVLPILDKDYPVKAKTPKQLMADAKRMLKTAEKQAGEIVAEAHKQAKKIVPDAEPKEDESLKPFTPEELEEEVTIQFLRPWNCEMAGFKINAVAKQKLPVKRWMAIKLIKAGAAT